MTLTQIRKASLFSVLAFCIFACTAAEARADLTPKQARKALTLIPGFQLKSGAVRVKSVSAGSTSTAEVLADVRVVFKFEMDQQGRWRVAEVRTGQDRWENIETIATALKTQIAKDGCTAADPPLRGKVAVDPSMKRARCLLGSLLGVEVPSDAIRIQEVSPLAIPLASRPSATVVAWVRIDARLLTDKSGWRVAELRTGNHDWVALEPLAAAVNEEKQKQARAELELMAQALEKFRKDRGSYIVSDNQGVAIDYLSPRYLPQVIRLDPWHQPYKYIGDGDHFTLRSTGPDGKENTPDDLSINRASNQ
jgi:hypothetical protein